MSNKDDSKLKNIFNRFYPKSQTTDQGKKLYKLAWAIEILVVLAGLATAYIMMKAQMAGGDVSKAAAYSIGLTFTIAAIAELTKIPLATAFYYAVRYSWKMLFLLALILINILTFETIINGMQRNWTLQTKEIKGLQYTLANIVDSRINAASRLAEQKDTIQQEIDTINKNITVTNERISQVSNSLQSEKEIIYSTSSDGGLLKNLSDSRQSKIEERDKLSQVNAETGVQSINCDSSFISRSGCDNAEALLLKNEKRIDQINDEIADLDLEIKAIYEKIEKQSVESMRALNDKYNSQLENLRQNKSSLQNQLEIQNQKNLKLDEDSISRLTMNQQNIDKETELIEQINQLAMDNLAYGWAQLLKGKEKVETKENGSDDLILSHGEKQFHLITDDDLSFAFWIIFGAMAVVISLAGTMVAMASLHLQDPRMHEERQKTNIGTIEKLLRSSRRYLVAARKRLLSPKIVEIEKEVTKEVPKEVVKEVPVTKIEYRDVEKEVIRRELVHIPLYTNDKELLGTTTFKDLDITSDELKKYKNLNMSSDELAEILEEIRKRNNKPSD